MKILIVGASGMIGSAVMRVLSENRDLQVFGSIREDHWKKFFSPKIQKRLISGFDLLQTQELVKIFEQVHPDVVINCVGVTKHKLGAEDPIVSIPINSLLPHRLSNLSRLVGSRVIHISTDCVFSGDKGNYVEEDLTDGRDLYGKTKVLGEIFYPNTITLRTSTIGHELQSRYGLLEWFLSQTKSCKGFTNAIFSGIPTIIFANIIREVIINHHQLQGLYHVAAEPINKFELLDLISKTYQKDIEIIRDNSFRIDRSLNSKRFRLATGYEPPAWPELIKLMHAYK
jgi:dTDP-4-dehydrorhamnose reductase